MGIKIEYIVRQDDDPVEVQVSRYHFFAGAPVDVDDPLVITTLMGNPWFRIEGEPTLIGDASRDNRDPEPVVMVPERKRGRPSNAERAARAAAEGEAA